MKESYTYRCPLKGECKLKKNCFILKTEQKLKESLEVIYKCQAEKREVPIKITPENFEK